MPSPSNCLPVPGARYVGPLPLNTLASLGVSVPPPPLVLACWGSDEARMATPTGEWDAPWWLYFHLRDRLLAPALAAALADDPRGVAALGSSDAPATVVLVLDARHNVVWVADRLAAERVVRPPTDRDPLGFTPRELRALALAALAPVPPPVPVLGPITVCPTCTNSRWVTIPTGFSPCPACWPAPP